ncbi:MAG TPA: hypothetical protein VIV58_37280 [Kofleriaceae bacterium]
MTNRTTDLPTQDGGLTGRNESRRSTAAISARERSISAPQRAWEEGCETVGSYKGQTSRSGDFNAVHTWKANDGTQVYLVGEGKGGTADLGGKWVKNAKGGMDFVQQGSQEYFKAICDEMMRSSDPNAQRAGESLLSVLDKGVDLDGNKARIIYEKVQVPVDLEDAPKMVTKERSTIDRFLVTLLDVAKPGKRGTP